METTQRCIECSADVVVRHFRQQTTQAAVGCLRDHPHRSHTWGRRRGYSWHLNVKPATHRPTLTADTDGSCVAGADVGRQTWLLIFTYLLFFCPFLRKAVAFCREIQISDIYRWASCYPVTGPTWSIFLAQFLLVSMSVQWYPTKTYIYIYKYISL